VRVVRKANVVVQVVGGVESGDPNLCALLEKQIWWFALLGESSLMTQTRARCQKNESGGSRCWRSRVWRLKLVRVVRMANVVVRVVGGGGRVCCLKLVRVVRNVNVVVRVVGGVESGNSTCARC